MIHQPQLLILDEPSAGVDVEQRRLMWDFLKSLNAQKVTIILTTHYLEEAEQLCRNLAIMQQGRIIAHSTMQQLLTHLDSETFILNLKPTAQSRSIEGYRHCWQDSVTLEVTVAREQGLNHLFQQLTQQQITVLSLRNQRNRLEQLLLARLDNGAPQEGGCTE